MERSFVFTDMFGPLLAPTVGENRSTRSEERQTEFGDELVPRTIGFVERAKAIEDGERLLRVRRGL